MATIVKYAVQSGHRYMVRYRKPDGRTTDKRGFKTKREADAWASTVEVSKLRGEFVTDSAGRVTVSELGEARLEARRAVVKPTVHRVEGIDWRKRVLPRWGDRAVVSIRPSEITAWVAELHASGLSATVIARSFGILAGILDDAVTDRSLARNPARGVKLPRKRPAPRTYLTHAEVDALADACLTPERALIVRLLAYTGLRWGEMVALRVRHLDMLRRRIHVEDNAPEVGGVPTPGTPKTHERRSVPFPAFLAADLARQCEGRGRDVLVFGDGRKFVRRGKSGSGWLDRAVVRAGVPRVTAHELRHTAASLAISAGATPLAVQRLLGHASAAMTLDTYSDLFEDDLDRVAEAMDAARARVYSVCETTNEAPTSASFRGSRGI